MSVVNVNKLLVLECLKKLNDMNDQAKRCPEASREILELNAVVAILFNDAMLRESLERRTLTFTFEVDSMLRTLDKNTENIENLLKINTLSESSKWDEITNLAGRIYKLIVI